MSYVVKNAGLWIFQYGIDGTLTDVPYPGIWNGSLWTLAWEFMCYLAILGLGISGLLRTAWPLFAAFAFVWSATLFDIGSLLGSDNVDNALRFSLTFLAGAVLAKFQERIRLSWTGMGIAACLVLGSLWLPDYRLIAAPAMAYGLVGLGGMISHPRLAFRNDVSYGMYVYAFPVQQLVASSGLTGIGVFGFSVISALVATPLAAASWFLVESPVIRLNRRRQAKANSHEEEGTPVRTSQTGAPLPYPPQ